MHDTTDGRARRPSPRGWMLLIASAVALALISATVYAQAKPGDKNDKDGQGGKGAVAAEAPAGERAAPNPEPRKGKPGKRDSGEATGIPTKDRVRAALRSKPGSNVFWTGRTGECYDESDGVKPLAERFARARDQKTLEMRLADAGLKMPAFNTPDDKAKEIWRFASAEYARQTSGQAWAVVGNCLRDDNTWQTRELPQLKKSGKMKCVWKVDSWDMAHEKLVWHASGWKSKCKGPVHLRNKAAQACVVYDARDTKGPQGPHYGGSWASLHRGDPPHWLNYYGWAFIGGVPYHGTRGDAVSPKAKGYRYSIEPDSSGPDNPSYIVKHTDGLIAWFRKSSDKRPYKIEIVDRGSGWWFRNSAEPYKEVCTFENAVADSA